METKPPEVNGQDKEKLPDLPSDDHEFWNNAEKFTIIPEQVNKDCKHYLILMKPNEAQCKFCSWGIYLGVDDRIEEGKLYSIDKQII